MAKLPVANGQPGNETPASKAPATEPNGTPAEPQQQTKRQPPRKKKGKNYAQIHSKPLPLEIHPLPAFHPSNPISLLRLCYIYLSQLWSPPSSHPSEPYTGHFDPDTRSIHVTNPTHIRALWEMGFFGKASLSRSEPTWLDREKARLRAEADGGRGVKAAEEVTSKRREERRLFKIERARAERERIERQRALEGGGFANSDATPEDAPEQTPDTSADVTLASVGTNEIDDEDESLMSGGVPLGLHDAEPLIVGTQSTSARMDEPLLPNDSKSTPPTTIPEKTPSVPTDDAEELDIDIQNQEHLQLTLEEAFFLSYALGVLDIRLPAIDHHQPTSTPPSTADLLTLFATHSTFPTDQPLARARAPIPVPSLAVNNHPLHARAVSHAIASAPLVKDPTESSLRVPMTAAPLTPQPPPALKFPDPDNGFLLNYVVYHHFRSLGWVVRPGLKFGVDYVLYNRGPVFSHAEFAVLIMPSYTDPYWMTPAGRARRRVKEEKDWWWLHCVNRVQGQVKKTLVLCYVEVPRPPVNGGDGVVSVGRLLRRYKVREFVVRRWAVNRSRD